MEVLGLLVALIVTVIGFLVWREILPIAEWVDDQSSGLLKWKRLLDSTPSGSRLVTADDMVEVWRVNPIRHSYWTARGWKTGDAMRIYCPAGYLVRLPFVCGWSKRRILDGDAFVLRMEGSGPCEMILLKRAMRWQLFFSDNDQLKSKDNYRMTCHLAVHAVVRSDKAGDSDLISLFDSIEEFRSRVREFALGALRTELKELEYREAMYLAPKIVQDLNGKWLEGVRNLDIQSKIKMNFSCLIVKPRKEAEFQFISANNRRLREVQEKRGALQRTRNTTRSDLSGRAAELSSRLTASLESLGSGNPGGLVTVMQTTGMAFKHIRRAEDLLAAVDGSVLTDQILHDLDTAIASMRALEDLASELDQRARDLVTEERGDGNV
jgi:hypothetical protein